VQRGHNREPCFFAEEDFHTYLHRLHEALRENDVALHAYVLMTNHVHLLLTPKRAERVPRLVISLGRRYVQYINRTYRRTGTLWDSRYGVKGARLDFSSARAALAPLRSVDRACHPVKPDTSADRKLLSAHR
jgi:REP element-mobilizing transposase RayT